MENLLRDTKAHYVVGFRLAREGGEIVETCLGEIRGEISVVARPSKDLFFGKPDVTHTKKVLHSQVRKFAEEGEIPRQIVYIGKTPYFGVKTYF